MNLFLYKSNKFPFKFKVLAFLPLSSSTFSIGKFMGFPVSFPISDLKSSMLSL